jgi:hypothetical protein
MGQYLCRKKKLSPFSFLFFLVQQKEFELKAAAF